MSAQEPPMSERFLREGRLDREAVDAELRRFLHLILRETHLELEYEIVAVPAGADAAEGPEIIVNFRGVDQDLLLGHQADLLLALEYLALRWLGFEARFQDRIRFDSGDYRALHLEELKLSARVAAQRVRETNQPFHFNPMTSRERRLIHLELTGAPGVRTESEGAGERRHLVIYPVGSKR
jgi:spoIIIJ-associated protein